MSATPATMLHVVAFGLQDQERLNVTRGNPSIAFYKSVLNRRTRWASQWRRVEFDNVADFGRTATTTLPINGELITRITLVVELPDIYSPQINAINNFAETSETRFIAGPSWAWTNGVGHALCSDVQLLINDQKIDQFDSQLLEVIDESERSVEHLDSTNLLIARDPSSYSDQQMINLYNNGVYQPKATVPQSNPQIVEVVFPFWFNKGPGATPLPIQALNKDKVQLRVTFRPVQDLVYTSSRIDPSNPPLSPNQGAGPLPNIADCGFFYYDIASSTLIKNGTSSANLMAQDITTDSNPNNPADSEKIPQNPFPGGVTRDFTMPSEYHITDAYWIVEYVSLEDREASAFRMADLELPIIQHVAIPPVTTEGAQKVFVPLNQSGLVRDLTWVAQRVEAPSYNAHFLFSRELAQRPVDGTIGDGNPCDLPWWPDAVLPNWDYGDGYIVPAFSTRFSDPIADAQLTYRSMIRFDHESPSIFRSLMPALNCRRVPLIDRYIYRYEFGFWSSGGLAAALNLPADEVRGCANWDKLPKRVLALTMDQRTHQEFKWEVDTTKRVYDYFAAKFYLYDRLYITSPTFIKIEQRLFSTFNDTEAFRFELFGGNPRFSTPTLPNVGGENNGNGAIVTGVLNLKALKRRAGFVGIYIRLIYWGSASLLLKDAGGYTWLAVAGGGGYGQNQFGGGGDAGSAVDIAWQGGNAAQTQNASTESGGLFVYNNIASTNDVSSAQTKFVSPLFVVVEDGVFQNVRMKFSINTSTTTQPIVITMNCYATEEDVESEVQVAGFPRFLTVPRSTVFVPMKTFQFTKRSADSVINLQAGHRISFSVEVTWPPGDEGDLNPFFAMVDTGNGDLACKATVKANTVDPNTTFFGGGGGGLFTDARIGSSGAATTGKAIKMPTTAVFVETDELDQIQTGATSFEYNGGDGYYGGGAGTVCGGGGSSYVSNLVSEITTKTNPVATNPTCRLTPLIRVVNPPPSFRILSWITRYNRLRINSGHGVLMFGESP